MTFGIMASAHVPFSGGATGYAAQVLADSPLAYWRLGESSGTTATDSSGNGRTPMYYHGNGIYNTPVAFGQGSTGLVSGDSDTAVEFDGTNDALKINDQAWMDVDYITVEAIIKPDVVNAYKSIVDRDALSATWGGTRCWQFRIANTSKLQVVWWTPSTGPHTLTGTTTLSVGTTYHVAWTYDGTNSTLYVNGSQDGQTAQSSTVRVGTAAFAIGQNLSTPSGAQPYDGIIDEVAYYGSGLSSTRIAAHASAAGL